MQNNSKEYYETVANLSRTARIPVAMFLLQESKRLDKLSTIIHDQYNPMIGTPSSLHELHLKFCMMVISLKREYEHAIREVIVTLPD